MRKKIILTIILISSSIFFAFDKSGANKFKNKGDIVEVEISQVGKLINPILDEESIIS